MAASPPPLRLLGALLVTLLGAPPSSTAWPVVANSSAAPTVEVRLGVLLPEHSLGYSWAWPRVKPALRLALEAQLRRARLDVDLAFASTEDENGDCDSSVAMFKAADMKCSQDPDVLLGLGCFYTSSEVAPLAQRWQLPLLRAGVYQRRRDSSTTVFGGPVQWPSLGAFLTQLHRRFHWTSQAAFVLSHIFYLEYFERHLPASPGFTVRVHEYKQPGEAVRFIRAEGRVVYICGSLEMLQEIMRMVQSQNMTNGDYIFMHVDIWGESLQAEGHHEAFKSWQSKESQDVGDFQEAFQTVLVVTPHEPQTPEYRHFQSQLIQRAQRDFGVALNDSLGTLVAGCFHDVLLLYLRALSETLQEGGTKRDTSRILEKMRGLKIQGVTGTVSINSNNDREMDFDLWAMKDVESGEYQVVAHYMGLEKQINWTRPIHWKKGSPPLDNPNCVLNRNDPSCGKGFL
ncbi:atrial natriuretic peptide receptor 2-like [Heteronotia binoei]|uniref:atrial natriuretic peptide receptor 2-like n=1 Tax=Heteronotia binoei TaxID=13085 RepID=UPI002931BAB5|nr:atrial natriuretic peptide receptor 2-like [Heteronotia binoei]